MSRPHGLQTTFKYYCLRTLVVLCIQKNAGNVHVWSQNCVYFVFNVYLSCFWQRLGGFDKWLRKDTTTLVWLLHQCIQHLLKRVLFSLAQWCSAETECAQAEAGLTASACACLPACLRLHFMWMFTWLCEMKFLHYLQLCMQKSEKKFKLQRVTELWNDTTVLLLIDEYWLREVHVTFKGELAGAVWLKQQPFYGSMLPWRSTFCYNSLY